MSTANPNKIKLNGVERSLSKENTPETGKSTVVYKLDGKISEDWKRANTDSQSLLQNTLSWRLFALWRVLFWEQTISLIKCKIPAPKN